jgi:hypothetical protein
MQGIVDPLDNYAIELHQYLDADFSGTTSSCVSQTIGAEKLVGVTNWLRAQGLQAFLGEFGVANNAMCLKALDTLLDYIDANAETWLGWTYWAAGPWWGDYRYSIEPDAQGRDRPQTAVLLEHLALPSNTAAEDGLADVFVLQQNYPNPFNQSTKIAFALPRPSHVSLKVYDVLGREIAILAAGVFAAGRFETVWEARGLPSGVYIYRFEAGAYATSKRLMLHR